MVRRLITDQKQLRNECIIEMISVWKQLEWLKGENDFNFSDMLLFSINLYDKTLICVAIDANKGSFYPSLGLCNLFLWFCNVNLKSLPIKY